MACITKRSRSLQPIHAAWRPFSRRRQLSRREAGTWESPTAQAVRWSVRQTWQSFRETAKFIYSAHQIEDTPEYITVACEGRRLSELRIFRILVFSRERQRDKTAAGDEENGARQFTRRPDDKRDNLILQRIGTTIPHTTSN